MLAFSEKAVQTEDREVLERIDWRSLLGIGVEGDLEVSSKPRLAFTLALAQSHDSWISSWVWGLLSSLDDNFGVIYRLGHFGGQSVVYLGLGDR